MAVTIKLEGIGEVDKALRELEADFGQKESAKRVLVPAVREALRPVLNQAIANAPKDTGGLALSLQIEARRPTARDKRSKYISRTDTVIGAVTTASAKKLAKMSQGKGLLSARRKLKKLGFENPEAFTGIESDARAIAQEFGTARNPEKPYLRPALEANAQTTVNNLAQILARRINEYRTKQKR